MHSPPVRGTAHLPAFTQAVYAATRRFDANVQGKTQCISIPAVQQGLPLRPEDPPACEPVVAPYRPAMATCNDRCDVAFPL